MLNPYFNNRSGSTNEQNLLEDLQIESIRIWGQEFYYMPRKLVGLDRVLNEDRLSEFKHAYPIEMYLESNSGFEGQGNFMQKFGLFVEKAATLTVARRTWNQLVGRFGETILPNRPAEGDLLYFPLTGGLFEIKFVQHEDVFYQLGKLYTYKLEVELFQYSSETIDTGVEAIDAFESLKTFNEDTTISAFGAVKTVTMTASGSGYTAATVSFVGDGAGATATATIGTGDLAGKVVAITVTNGGQGYTVAPSVVITGDGTLATATAAIEVDIDKPTNIGRNNVFQAERANSIFDASNPFGEIGT